MPDLPHERTDQGVKRAIEAAGYSRNPMSGVPGRFYTVDREADLKGLVREILKDIGDM